MQFFRKFALAVFGAILSLGAAQAQSVQQSSPITKTHVPYWVSNGVIGDGGTAFDSPITTLGVTANNAAAICVSSGRSTASGRQQMCFGSPLSAPGTISIQNYGDAVPQQLQFLINGTTIVPVGISGTPATNSVLCFSGTNSVVSCGLLASGGVITSGAWAGTAIPLANGGTGATTAAVARSNLGLGTMAVQDASAIAVTGGTVTGMPNPSVGADVANKTYVDNIAAGIIIVAPSTLATAAILPNSPVYSNGTLGVGATLTAGSNAALTVDGTSANNNDIILVKNQVSTFQNGIYTVTDKGSGGSTWVLTRVTYFDQAAEMVKGTYTFVTSGATLSHNAYVLQSTVATVGSDAVTWILFSTIGTSSITIAPGPGITASGTCTITSSGTCTLAVQQLVPGGRLTLTSGVAVTVTDVTGATAIYYAPYNSGFVPINTAGAMQLVSFISSQTDAVGLSVTLGSSWTADTNYDWFVGLNSSTPTLCSGPAWSGDTGRGTGAGTTELQLYNGIWTNKVSMTCRYANASTFTCAVNECTYTGSNRMVATGQAEDSAQNRLLFNNYNRESRKLARVESTTSWTSTANNWHPWNNANVGTANRITVLRGFDQEIVNLTFVDFFQTSTPSGAQIGIALDSVSTIGASSIAAFVNTNVTSTGATTYADYAGLGFHFLQLMEYGPSAGTGTFFGQSPAANSSFGAYGMTMQ